MDDDLARSSYGGHNEPCGRVTFTRSARKHRIPHLDVRHVIAHPKAVVELRPTDPPHRRRYLYLGVGLNKIELEVIVVRSDAGALLVIHAMRARKKYRHLADWSTDDE